MDLAEYSICDCVTLADLVGKREVSLVASGQIDGLVRGFQKTMICLHSLLSNLTLQVKNFYLEEFYFKLLRFFVGEDSRPL